MAKTVMMYVDGGLTPAMSERVTEIRSKGDIVQFRNPLVFGGAEECDEVILCGESSAVEDAYKEKGIAVEAMDKEDNGKAKPAKAAKAEKDDKQDKADHKKP